VRSQTRLAPVSSRSSRRTSSSVERGSIFTALLTPLILNVIGDLPGPMTFAVSVFAASKTSALATIPDERTAPAPLRNPRRDTSILDGVSGWSRFGIQPSNEESELVGYFVRLRLPRPGQINLPAWNWLE